MSISATISAAGSSALGTGLTFRHLWASVAVVLWVANLAGCAKPPPSWASRTSDDLLYQIRVPVTGEIALSGSARVSSETSEETRKGRTYFAVRAPSQLLLEAVTPSDETVAVLVTNGDRFMGFEVGDARCRTGTPCAENVGQLFPVALDGIQLVRLLHGRPPLIIGDAGAVSRVVSPARLRVVIANANTKTTQTIDFSPDGRDVISTEILRDGATALRIDYADYKTLTPNVRVPMDLAVDDPQRKSKVRIRVTDVNLFEPRPETFGTRCPVGKLIMPMTCSPDAIRPR